MLEEILWHCIQQLPRLLNRLIFHQFSSPAVFSLDDRDNLWQWRLGFLSLLRSPPQFQGHTLITHMFHAVQPLLRHTAAKLLFCSPHAVSEGGRKRYSLPFPPPPSWPAKMSGRSQRKRDYQRHGFRLYKCVSLFWCQQRIRRERVTFGDNKISSQACGAAPDRTHHRW